MELLQLDAACSLIHAEEELLAFHEMKDDIHREGDVARQLGSDNGDYRVTLDV